MLARTLSPFSERAFAILRIVVGVLFAFHGAQKLFGFAGGHEVPIASKLGVAGVIELTCGLLVALGLLTRFAAFLASGEMAVAYFTVHWHGTFDATFWPGVNGGEPAVLYCFVFLFIACHGAGIWSVDHARRGPPA
jgi:putative oxidoreductase